jgi:hypothetical protein
VATAYIKLLSDAFGYAANTVIQTDDAHPGIIAALNANIASRAASPGGTVPTYALGSPVGVLDGAMDALLDDPRSAASAELGLARFPALAAAFAGMLATLRRGYRSTCIGLVSDSTGDDKNGGAAPAEEWPRVFIRALGAAYPAYTVVEENWNDTLQGYDPAVTLQDGVGNGGGERGMLFSRATPGSVQYAGAAVTTALDIQAKINPGAWTDSADRTIVAKWDSGTNQRAFLFLLGANGSLAFNHSAAGTAAVGQKNSSTTIPAAVNPGNNTALWVRATLTLDNGATQHEVRFYTSADGQTWTQLGTPQTAAGVTTLFGGTAPYQVGAFTSGNSTPFGGRIFRVRVFGTIGGRQSVVPPILDDWENSSTASGNLSFVGAPVIRLLNGGQSGQNVAYFDNVTRRPLIHQPRGQQVVILSSGHNDGTQTRQTWLTNVAAWVNNIKTLLPGVPILMLGQNQTAPGGAFALTQQDVEHRATRGAMIAQWAASQAGVLFWDAFPLVAATDTIDNLHPTTGPGSGSEKWGMGLFEALRS